MRKPTHLALALLMTASAGGQKPASQQQPPAWNLDGLVIVGGRLPGQTPEDRAGILRATGAQPEQLRIARIRTPAGHLFIIQGLDQPLCNALGNCSAWVLDKGYHVLLTVNAESFRLQASTTPGQMDIVTYTVASGTSGSLQRWRVYGHGYRRIACANLTMKRTAPKMPLVPEIQPVACGR